MRRFIGLLTLGPLLWILVRLLLVNLPPRLKDVIRPIVPDRLLETRNGFLTLWPRPGPPPGPPAYTPPGPDDPESVDPLLGDSPGAHGVLPL